MTALLLILLLGPECLRVEVKGDATEVVALRDGVVRARAEVRGGRAEIGGLGPGTYDLQAFGPGGASAVERGLRTAPPSVEGLDATLVIRPVALLRVRTEPGATIWCDGVRAPGPDLPLVHGLHRLVVDHPERVSSAERLLRVTGDAEIDQPLEAGLILTGEVTDPEGAPIQGALVEVFADGYASRRSCFSDAQGRYGVSGVRGRVVSVAAQAPGRARTLRRVQFFPGEERARVALTLRPGSGVRVRARDPEGRALHGFEAVLLAAWYELALEEPRLRANDAAPRLTACGAVRFAHLQPGRRCRVLVSAEGYRPAATAVFVAPAPGRTFEPEPVVLRPGASLEGRLRGVAGAAVVLRGPEGELRTRCDRAGRFRFDGLDPGPHVLEAEDSGAPPQQVDLAEGEARQLGWEPPEGAETRTLEGIVWDADGRPLEDVEVVLRGRTRTTDAGGAFRFEVAADRGERFTLAFAPGPDCRALADDPHLPRIERDIEAGSGLRIQLERAGNLWVRFESGGRARARARVRIEGTTGTGMWRQLPRGAFDLRVRDLPVGTYVVELAAPGWLGTGGAVVRVDPRPQEPAVVRVYRGRSVRGRVVRRLVQGEPGTVPLVQERPVEGGWVSLVDGDPLREAAVAPVDAEGRFALEGLPSAPVLLAASVPGSPVATALIDLSGGDEAAALLVVEEAAEAAVKVMSVQDRPLPDARVRILTERGIDVRDLASLARLRRVVADEADIEDLERLFVLRRDPSGRIAAPFLAPGSYRVHISADGFEPVRVGVRARTPQALADLQRFHPERASDLDFASPVYLKPAGRPEEGKAAAKD